jgi:outer membrane protein assembly factor BamE (lipoprotein component of BamABCDE complex)
MKRYRIIILLLLIAFLFGCAGSSKKMNLLSLGMTKQQVIETIGEPTSTSAKRNTEYLHYLLSTDGFYSDSYYVRLLDGKVESYGWAGSYGLGY